MSEPAPYVHHEILKHHRTSGGLVGVTLAACATDPQLADSILSDPTGLYGPLAAMAREYPVNYQMLRSVLAYCQAGEQVMVVGPRLQRAFADTECSRVPAEFLRLPYPCFYLATPGCEAKLWGGEDTGWHQVGGAYVQYDAAVPTRLCFMIVGLPNEKSTHPLDDATFWFDTDLAALSGDTYDMEAGFASIVNDPANDLSDEGSRQWGADPSLARRVREELLVFFRIALNALLYINSANADLQLQPNDLAAAETARLRRMLKTHKGRRDVAATLRDKLQKVPRYRTTLIGPRAERALRDCDREGCAAPSPRAHWRRSHWQAYQVGPRKGVPTHQRAHILHWIIQQWVEGAELPSSGPRRYRLAGPGGAADGSVSVGANEAVAGAVEGHGGADGGAVVEDDGVGGAELVELGDHRHEHITPTE